MPRVTRHWRFVGLAVEPWGWLKRQNKASKVAKLPEDAGDARLVLDYARDLLEYVHYSGQTGGSVVPMRPPA